MSFFCTIDKSKSGSLVSKIVSRQFFTFSYPPLETRKHAIQQACHQVPRREDTSLSSDFSKWFISALVGASKCRRHAGQGSSTPNHSPAFLQQTSRVSLHSRRLLHTKSPARSAFPQPDGDREELLNLVDYYDEPVAEREPVTNLPNLQKPDLIISEKKEDVEWPKEEYRWHSANEETNKMIKILEQALMAKSKPEEPPGHIYDLYRALPSPRVPYLSAKLRHKLLYYLAMEDRKDERTSLRYLSVIDDMKDTATPLDTAEWNMAIYFAGKCVSRISDAELEIALRTWREMERSAGVTGNHATFNILFDMAVKAGRYNLADMMYDEMLKRGHVYNRFHYVSRIYYHGLRRDGDSARRVYKEFVASGEIVDTVVLNCLIAALFKSQEPQAAIQVFERMKVLHSEKSHQKLPPTDIRKKRRIRQALVRAARISKEDDKLREKFQEASIIAPDLVTYRTLLQYYSIQVGELEKVSSLLDEMNWYKVPLNGLIFLTLFKGFSQHGGIRFSEWTGEKLRGVWDAFIDAVKDESIEDVFVGKWAIIWALRAFKKCEGTTQMMDAWEEVKELWEPDEREHAAVMDVVQHLFDQSKE